MAIKSTSVFSLKRDKGTLYLFKDGLLQECPISNLMPMIEGRNIDGTEKVTGYQKMPCTNTCPHWRFAEERTETEVISKGVGICQGGYRPIESLTKGQTIEDYNKPKLKLS